MRSLVFGAAGFVGGHLVSHLREQGDDVTCAVQSQGAMGAGEREVVVDITDPNGVAAAIKAAKPDVVYHLAGISFVPEAEDDFAKVLAVNVGGTSHITHQCAALDRPVSLVFVSSAEVYGKVAPEQLPITEATPVQPANNYSLSKRMAELVVERYGRSGSLSCAIVRPFNHIGPGQDKRFVTASFALQLALIAHGRASPVLRVGNLDARRDFSDVRDIVRGYRLIAGIGGGTYNIGSGVSHSVQEVLDSLINLSGLSVEIERDPARMRPSEVPEVYGSYQALKRACGWEPRYSLEDSLRDVYQYWYDQVGKGTY
ncbi:MAG: GDP-mannose 4,6-dehydratase [Pseudomonadota bacterium]